MISPKVIFLIAFLAIIMLFVCPSQSMPTDNTNSDLSTRQKRWTFNTWRLHGRRQLPNDYSTPQNQVYPYQIYSDEDELVRQIHERLLQAFPELNRH
ncbi:hypothetical protein I4U23_026758 [Adineta vaga]|nr:hypothetical protein I4U23_026758 [Adineta vaga]